MRQGSAPALRPAWFAIGPALAVAAGLIVGCTAAEERPSGDLEITFQSQPDPPTTGENTFEVRVTEAGGAPITDADVSVGFYMAAMPSMNMPEMKNSVPLEHEGAGRYRGTGSVMMGGAWDVTVTVRRGGREIGSRKLSVTAR